MSLFSRLSHERTNHNRIGGAGMLPMPFGAGSRAECASHDTILVALTGSVLDREIMTLACTMALARRTNMVHAIYAAEVPRSLAITDEMPVAQAAAAVALERAGEDAALFGIGVVKEYIQSRDIGECLVQVARRGDFQLLVMGLPSGDEAEADATEKVDNVLRKAPCRVWVVRDMPLAA